jgi:hypothetical protein
MLPVSLLVFPVRSVLPESFCTTRISYFWQPQTENESPVDADKKLADESLGGGAPESLEVAYGVVRRTGDTEEVARELCREGLEEKKAEALKECRELHENLSGCISGKFTTMSALLKQLDFEARKELEASIASDCRKISGRCLKAEASEVECSGAAAREGEDDTKK